MKTRSGELWNCSQTTTAWLCHIFPAWVWARGLGTQIKFDCRWFWAFARSSSHNMAEPQHSLSGDSQSIQTDYMIGSPRHQNFINQSQLHLPGSCASPTVSPGSQEWKTEGGICLLKAVCFRSGGKDDRNRNNIRTWLQFFIQYHPAAIVTGPFCCCF